MEIVRQAARPTQRAVTQLHWLLVDGCVCVCARAVRGWVGGSGRVGSGRVGSGRVGSGRVGSGRVGLGWGGVGWGGVGG